MSRENRYPVLLFICTLYRFFGWCSILMTVFGVIFVFNASSVQDAGHAFIAALLIILVGGFSSILQFAIAEGIVLLVDIEQNTRLGTGARPTDDVRPGYTSYANFPSFAPKGSEFVDAGGFVQSRSGSVIDALGRLRAKGVDVQVARSGSNGLKFTVVNGGTTLYFYSESDFLAYAAGIS